RLMNNSITASLVLPGVVPLLLFLLFTYLYVQSLQPYFRAWQMAWAAYTLHFGLDLWSKLSSANRPIELIASLLLVAMSLCILVSTRLTRRMTSWERSEALHRRWHELLVAAAGIGLSIWDFLSHSSVTLVNPPLPLEIGIAAV